MPTFGIKKGANPTPRTNLVINGLVYGEGSIFTAPFYPVGSVFVLVIYFLASLQSNQQDNGMFSLRLTYFTGIIGGKLADIRAKYSMTAITIKMIPRPIYNPLFPSSFLVGSFFSINSS
jgi:hypothetical protein